MISFFEKTVSELLSATHWVGRSIVLFVVHELKHFIFTWQGIILSLLDRKEEAERQFMIYQSIVPEEFPQKRFLDDIVLEARTKSLEHLLKDVEGQSTSTPSHSN